MAAKRLYPTTLSIGPKRHPADQVRDAEAFCRSYLDREFDRMGHYERGDDYDESLSLLITHLWRLNETFDRERNDCFANYARSIIPKRAYDVSVRRLLGRNGARLPIYDFDQLDEAPGGSRPEPTQPELESSADPDRGSDDPGLLALRDRERAWAAGVLGIRTPRVAA